jgi:hypothetical protein
LDVCELCKNPFDMQEEYGSLWEIIKKNVSYLLSDKKRIVMMALYCLYLFLFGKRFI